MSDARETANCSFTGITYISEKISRCDEINICYVISSHQDSMMFDLDVFTVEKIMEIYSYFPSDLCGYP